MTKDQLSEWRQHPITIEVFKEVEAAVAALREQSPIRDTAEQTAMQASYNEGWIEGVQALHDAYDVLGGDQ